MKPLNSLAVFVWLLIISCMDGYAQTTIGFTYDESGNRDTRSVVTLGSIDNKDNVDFPVANLLKESVKDQIGKQQVRISYNQEEETLQVHFPYSAGQEATIELTSPEGKPVMKKTGIRSGHKIELSGYPSGSYRMTISVGEEKNVSIKRKQSQTEFELCRAGETTIVNESVGDRQDVKP
ncbi:MAG: hypothetical protein AB2L20_28545 [Mangrovibacterium sp.]